MLHGHIDQITRVMANGWAADTDRPDEPVSVSIFVDGRKVAQIVCDVPRSDLVQAGVYGRGRHGFRYAFNPPLPSEVETTVTVRLTESGNTLGRGRVKFQAGGTTAAIIETPPHRAEQLIVAAPSDPRGLVELFKLFDAACGLYPLLCRLDYRGITPDHIAYATGVAAGAPVPPQPRPWTGIAARDLLNDTLHDAVFQHGVLAHVLRAFPKRRRLLFVHVPKCAGSDLSMHLAMRYPSLEQRLMDPQWTTPDQLFAALAVFAREAGFSRSIFLRGHSPLDFFIAADLIRPADRVFTIVRDPVEIAISQVNYVLTKFQLNIESGVVERDTREWLRLLNLPRLPDALSPEFIIQTARQALANPSIVEPNSMCRWLGGGGADAVACRLARHRVEITDTAHYHDWLGASWGIDGCTRQNESIKFISLADLSHKEVGQIQERSQADRLLYGRIQGALDAAGAPSIMGADLLTGADAGA